MLKVEKDVAADNTDVFAGTDLENIPEPGILRIYVASTAADTLMTITAPNQGTPVRRSIVTLRANAAISILNDIPIDIPVIQGKYNVDIDVVAAATVKIVGVFYTLDEAIAEAQGGGR